MNIPQIAYQSYRELKTDPRVVKLVRYLIINLRKIKSSVGRARFIHEEVDKTLEKLFARNPFLKDTISCKKSCTYCCHTQVSVTADEAELLSQKIKNGEVQVDRSKLYLQAKAKNDYKYWMDIPYEQRKCIFLSEKGECSVYKDRPSVCRTNYSLSAAEKCDTSNGGQSKRLLRTELADVIIASAFSESSDNGALPYMVDSNLKGDVLLFSTKK